METTKIPRNEFTKVLAVLTAGCGKSLTIEAANLYYELLGDEPLDLLQAAVKVVILEHSYASFPTIGQISQTIGKLRLGKNGRILGIEAWGMVNNIVRDWAWEVAGPHVQSLPPLVRATARMIGWRSIYDSTDREVLRSQFCRAYDALAERERKEESLPLTVRDEIAALEAPREMTRGIGRLPE